MHELSSVKMCMLMSGVYQKIGANGQWKIILLGNCKR